MNEFILKLGLQPGDRIIVPKSELRIIQHHAVYLGQNFQGIHLFAENKIGIGVQLVNAGEFFKEVIEVSRIEKFQGNNTKRKEVVQRALQKLGLPYDLINYNCQHFANDVLSKRVESEQVKLFFTMVVFVILFLLLINQNKQFSYATKR